MPVDDDVIGLVRAHRWASVPAQTKRLKEAGCTRIFDLDQQNRRDLERVVSRRPVLLVFAFLLAEPERTRSMWADFLGSLERVEAKGGSVVDVDSNLDSKAHPAAFRDVVAGQVRRHNQGERAHERKGKPGRQLVVFTKGQIRQARDIWKDVANYPHYDDAKVALAKIVSAKGEPFSQSRAFRRWKGRPKVKD